MENAGEEKERSGWGGRGEGGGGAAGGEGEGGRSGWEEEEEEQEQQQQQPPPPRAAVDRKSTHAMPGVEKHRGPAGAQTALPEQGVETPGRSGSRRPGAEGEGFRRRQREQG